MAKSDLQKHIDRLVEEHGGLRPAARACKVDPGYLWRIQKGRTRAVSPKILEKLGLKRIETFKPL